MPKISSCRLGQAALIASAITTAALTIVPSAAAQSWSSPGGSHASPLVAKLETSGKFTPVTPVRILDTRIGLGAPKRIPALNEVVKVPVRGQNGVPADATAVLVNVTVAEGTNHSPAVVYSCDRTPDMTT